MPTRVLVMDQRDLIRTGVRSICLQRDDLYFVGETTGEFTDLSILREQSVDVVVISDALIEQSALDLITMSQSASQSQRIRFLVLTGTQSSKTAIDYVQAGASGCLTDQASVEEIAIAIRSIAQGRVFISQVQAKVGEIVSPPVQDMAPESCEMDSRRQQTVAAASLAMGNLSAREREVLMMIADGMTNKQAAAQLFLSVKTVETYRARVMRKLNLRDRVGLVRYARQHFGQTANSA